jgi:hypothetical protein
MTNIKEDIFAIWAKWRSIPCWLRQLHKLGYSQETLDKLEYVDNQFYLFADKEEQMWRKLQRNDSARSEVDLLATLPNAKSMILEKIREWQRYEANLKLIIERKLKNSPSAYFEKLIFREWIKINEASDILVARRHIKRLGYLIKPQSSSRQISQADIDTAKESPIQNLLSDYDLRPSGKNFKALCPFHAEKTPSFYVYPLTNSFYCFGCGLGGDVLNLVERLYGCGFIEAVLRFAPARRLETNKK